MSLLSTAPYKGTRDFYPEEMRSREWAFERLMETVRRAGYERIDAPIIEPIEIYLAKTSQEIVSQQIYSFTDRGDRKVAIRPEMTPTVARMAAARLRELPKPIRWFSIPNLWRYERPGKGRLREHWQLNCDLLAAPDEDIADLEIIQLAISLLQNFGAGSADFTVSINDREVLNSFLSRKLALAPENHAKIARAMDRQAKVTQAEFETELTEAGVGTALITEVIAFLNGGTEYLTDKSDWPGVARLMRLLERLSSIGLSPYVKYDPSVVRGFDYYNGMVFEVFDSHPDNRRSLFGGGRYNNLVSAFSKEKANAVGFGMGDVTLFDFLKSHDLLPEFPSRHEVYVAVFPGEEELLSSVRLAGLLRTAGFNTLISVNPGKLPRQFEEAESKGIVWFLICGETERAKETVLLKHLVSKAQTELPLEQLLPFLHTWRREKNQGAG